MKGFDKQFNDFPDYIIGITKAIWEDRQLSSLHDYYAPDIIVRSPSAVVQGNKKVIAATLATLSEFPDRQLLAEDVIWSGKAETGMLSSHRIYSTATHSKCGIYGNPTGKKLRYRVIADCHAINNQINDEWLIRDQGAIVRQLGYHPKDYVISLIDKEGGSENSPYPLTAEKDIAGPYQGNGNDNIWGQKLADILNAIMTDDLSVIYKKYDRAVNLYYPGGIETVGFAGADQFWTGLRASFPDATFTIHHQIGRDDPMISPRAAIRWSLCGKHSGWGSFAKPSNKNVYVMGITHAEFGPWGLRREYTLFDELAIWKQIILQEKNK